MWRFVTKRNDITLFTLSSEKTERSNKVDRLPDREYL